jgi:hypothetical protein
MTLAEIIATTRGLCNENSNDSGALLSDAGNLKEFINDAAEQVMLDLMPLMPGQFLTKENITLVAGTQSYTLTAKFWQIYKIAKNVTGEPPRELDPIDPLDEPYYMETAERDSEPTAYYVLGDTVYFCPIPSSATTSYATAWLVRPELAAVPTDGPTYIPAVAHRLIAYQAAALVATMLEKDPTPFVQLYARRLSKVAEVWAARFQNKPRFVRESVAERSAFSMGVSTERDTEW